MIRRVLVTGAAGFVGRAVIDRLKQTGLTVRAAVRDDERLQNVQETVRAEVTDFDALVAATHECDAVVHLVAIIKEKGAATFENVIAQGTRNVVAACNKNHVKRIVYISALGTPTGKGKYYESKRAAEEAVSTSGISHVILRPSAVVGPNDSFIGTFLGKFMPIAGGGTKFQPVYFGDVGDIVSKCVLGSMEGCYEVGGPEVVSFRQMIEVAERKRGKRGIHPSVPLGLAKIGAKLLFDPLLRLGVDMPSGSDAMSMLDTDNVCSPEEYARTLETFCIDPVPYELAVDKPL